MYQFIENNVNDLALTGFNLLNEHGIETETSKGYTKTLRYVTTKLTNPLDRYLSLNGRNNSIAAAIAETFWVLSGSTIIDGWLSKFLHRAKLYSDDGYNWYRGYGKMLYQNNQLAGVLKYLLDDANTRQAVLSIYDPNQESYDSVKNSLGYSNPLNAKDKSCNNLLYFSVDNKKLNLTVCNRSNDVIYGAYSINLFEFTFIQEIVSAYLHYCRKDRFSEELGDYVVFSNNYHLYLSKDTFAQKRGNNLAEKQFNAVLAENKRTGNIIPQKNIKNISSWIALDFYKNTKNNPDEFVISLRNKFKNIINDLMDIFNFEDFSLSLEERVNRVNELIEMYHMKNSIMSDYVIILSYELFRKHITIHQKEIETILSNLFKEIKEPILSKAFSKSRLFCPIV